MPALVQLLFFCGIIAIFWMLVLRPARRQQRAQQELIAALQVGDEVVLSSGIFGRITGIDDDEGKVMLEVAPGTVLTVARQVVVRRIEDEPTPTEQTSVVDEEN